MRPADLKAEYRELMHAALSISADLAAVPIPAQRDAATEHIRRRPKRHKRGTGQRAQRPARKRQKRALPTAQPTKTYPITGTLDGLPFAGRTSTGVTFPGAREVDTMWHSGRPTHYDRH